MTKQNYTEFVELSKELREKGLEILAFPCNQFGSQEPGSPEEILKFVEKFDAKDRLVFFEKAHVNGKNTREVFGYLKQELPTEGNDSNDIRWNFAKFLISPDGKPVKRFAPTSPPSIPGPGDYRQQSTFDPSSGPLRPKGRSLGGLQHRFFDEVRT